MSKLRPHHTQDGVSNSWELCHAIEGREISCFPPSQICSSCRSFKGQHDSGQHDPQLWGKWHSERVSERAFEQPLKTSKNPLKTLWKPLKTSQNLSKPLKTSEALPLRDPLRGRFPSQNLSGLLPLIVLPLNLSPIYAIQLPDSFDRPG